jgi:hypothetical protein
VEEEGVVAAAAAVADGSVVQNQSIRLQKRPGSHKTEEGTRPVVNKSLILQVQVPVH